jgi:hypothetical protein
MLPWQVQNFPFWVCLLQLEANYREQLMKDTFQNKFDELAKGLAQSVTRRDAFKKFGVGLAGMVLACFGLANRAGARTKVNGFCEVAWDAYGNSYYTGFCLDETTCQSGRTQDCRRRVSGGPYLLTGCNGGARIDMSRSCSF